MSFLKNSRKGQEMRKVLVIVFMLCSLSGYSQFNLGGSVGYGIKINDRLDYDLFQSSIALEPGYNIGRFQMQGIALAINNDSLTDIYSGFSLGYRVWDSGNQGIDISAHGLIGTEGRRLYGGGITYSYENLNLKLSGSQEYREKELWINLGVGMVMDFGEANRTVVIDLGHR